jgi:hypothetical protein
VRRDSAVRRLAAIAEDCQRVSGLQDGKAPVLTAAYAFAGLVDGAAELPVVQVAFVLNLPAEELTWCAEPGRHRSSVFNLAALLGLGAVAAGRIRLPRARR